MPTEPLVRFLVHYKLIKESSLTKDVIEQFNRLGCSVCEMELMRRPSIRPLTDRSRPPVGIRWAFDSIEMPCNQASTNFKQITNFADEGSRAFRPYEHKDNTMECVAVVIRLHIAWVKAKVGVDVVVYRKDNHPTYRSVTVRQVLHGARLPIHNETSADYVHQGAALPENSFLHGIPKSLAMLRGAQMGLRHLSKAFMYHCLLDLLSVPTGAELAVQKAPKGALLLGTEDFNKLA